MIARFFCALFATHSKAWQYGGNIWLKCGSAGYSDDCISTNEDEPDSKFLDPLGECTLAVLSRLIRQSREVCSIMSMSREWLGNLPEADVYPLMKRLLEAKKFKDVRITHGNDELGRDLVASSPSGQGLDTAVVVKIGAISSQAKGNKKTNEVISQALQCYGTPSPTATSDSDGTVKFLIMVTTGAISEPALKAIASALRGAHRAFEIWDGDRFWSEICQYLGATSIFSSLNEIIETANRFEAPYELLPYGRRLAERPLFGQISDGKTGIDLFMAGKGQNPPPIKGTFKAKVPIADQARFSRVFTHGGEFQFSPGQAKMHWEGPLGEILADTDLVEIRITPLNNKSENDGVKQAAAQESVRLKYRALDESGGLLAESAPFTLSKKTDGSGFQSEVSSPLMVAIQIMDGSQSGSMGFGVQVPETGIAAGEFVRAVRFLDACSRAKSFITVNLCTQTESDPWDLDKNAFAGVDDDMLALCDALEWAEKCGEVTVPPRMTGTQWKEGLHLARLLKDELSLRAFTLRIVKEEAGMWLDLAAIGGEVGIQGYFKRPVSLLGREYVLYSLLTGPSLTVEVHSASQRLDPSESDLVSILKAPDGDLKNDDVILLAKPGAQPLTITSIGNQADFVALNTGISLAGPEQNLAIKLDVETAAKLQARSTT